MTTRSIVVVSGGLSVPSSSRLLADRLAAATGSALSVRGDDAVVETVELRDHAHAVTDHLLTGFAPAGLKAVLDAVRGADGFIAVTPIFSASFSGLFKSFLDVLEPGSLDGRPTLIGATGGTARHSLALEYAVRPVLAYARARVAPTAVFAASDDWGTAGAGSGLAARIERAGGELADLVLGTVRTQTRDPFDDVTPFERLLAGDA
ncbi:MAG: FMN reductase [Lapillicoccus sp.]